MTSTSPVSFYQSSLTREACGSPSYTNRIREAVILNSNNMSIDFIESDYRPNGTVSGHQRQRLRKQIVRSNNMELERSSIYSVTED